MKTKMVGLDFSKLAPKEAYKILLGSVIPRPIAWVSTVDSKGQPNLAPFSYFTAVSYDPPTVLFCPVTAELGREKDTLRNILQTKQFVINVVTESNVALANATSAPFGPGVNEFEACGVTPIPSEKVRPPRVAESPIHLECELIQVVEVGEKKLGSGNVVIGRVVFAHVASDAIDAHHHIDLLKIKPVSRLAGSDYAPVRDKFSIQRPPG